MSSGFLSKKLKIKIQVYETIVLPVVLYGCEIWSLTLWQSKVFDNRILRRIFGSKKDERDSGGDSTIIDFIVRTVHIIPV